jgi:S1-C subfamily serine protease
MPPRLVLVIALLAGALGAAVAIAVTAAGGLLDRSETRTVVVQRGVSGTTVPDREAPVRPLLGNGFDPAAIYAARASGVVTIYAEVPGGGRAQGSGFVVDDHGTILTSAHVITNAGVTTVARGADSVVVEFSDGERVAAEIVGWDLFADTGVVRVERAAHPLEPVPLGDSARVAVGDPVAAIGSPFGNQGSLAVGVVSAIGRAVQTLTSGYRLTDAIQIDAPINRGNSGGPLFDARGRVIGINAQIRSDSGLAEGVGFAVPVNAARRALDQLLATGRVAYPYLGIRTEDVTPGLARRFDLGAREGALVAIVEPDSPAKRAGLRGGTRSATYNGLSVSLGGDLIVAIGRERVRSAADIARVLISDYLPGDSVELGVLREGRRRVFSVVLGERLVEPRE